MAAILTTESVPPNRRAAYWEEMVSQHFVRARCRAAPRSAFTARIRANEFDALVLSDVSSHGTDVLRTRELAARGDADHFLVSLQVEGTGRLEQARRSALLQPGDLVLYDTSRPYQLSFAAAQRQVVLRIPRAELLARLPSAESQVGIGIPGQLPVAQVASGLLRSLAALHDLPAPRTRLSLASTLLDLVLDGLLAMDGERASHRAGVRLLDAQRLAQRHFADAGFSVSRWAAQLGITERYLRLLFEPTRQTPSEYLWAQRLTHAARTLRAVESRHRSITLIALDCGFSDSAHFSRAFRAAHGLTPRAFRAAAD